MEQLDYVLSSIQSNIFLKACPGGGKTEVVGLKAAYEFHAWTRRHCGIAILTFTNNAADEIRKRVQQYAGVQNSGYPHFIGTVDSWLHRYLAHPFGHLTTNYLGRPHQTVTDKSIRLVDEDEREGWINNYICKTRYYCVDKTGKRRSLPLYANSLRYDCESGEWRIPEGKGFISAQDYFDSPGVSSFRSENPWFTLGIMIAGFETTKEHFLCDGFATHHDIEWIFLLHVLPRGFQRIRQFGLLANRRRREQLARCRQLLGATAQATGPLPSDYKSLYQTVTGESLEHCPLCRTGIMKLAAPIMSLVSYRHFHGRRASLVAAQAIDSS